MSTSGCSIPTSSSPCIILNTQTSSGEQVDPKSTDKSFIKDIVDIGSIEFNPEIENYLSQKDHFLKYIDNILKNFNI